MRSACFRISAGTSALGGREVSRVRAEIRSGVKAARISSTSSGPSTMVVRWDGNGAKPRSLGKRDDLIQALCETDAVVGLRAP